MYICKVIYLVAFSFLGIAKENLRRKHPDLMKKFSMMRFAHGPDKRPAEKPMPAPPKVKPFLITFALMMGTDVVFP